MRVYYVAWMGGYLIFIWFLLCYIIRGIVVYVTVIVNKIIVNWILL